MPMFLLSLVSNRQGMDSASLQSLEQTPNGLKGMCHVQMCGYLCFVRLTDSGFFIEFKVCPYSGSTKTKLGLL